MAYAKCLAQAQIMFALLINDFHPKENTIPSGPMGAFSPASPEELWNTHSVLNTGHLLLMVSTGQGYDYPHFTEQETGAQTCPRYPVAKKQMTGTPRSGRPQPCALPWTP